MKNVVMKDMSIIDSLGGSERDAKIRNSLQSVLSLVASAHVHSAHLDVDGVYTNWDGMSEKMFGYRRQDVVNRMHISNMFALAEDFYQVWSIVRDHRKFHGDIAFRNLDGVITVVRLSIVKEYSADGATTGYSVHAVDRSDELKLEHQLENHLITLSDCA